MFSSKTPTIKSAKEISSSGKPTKRGISMLGDGCSFEGKMFLQGESRIGGKVQGSVISEGSLTIEESAHIEGDVIGMRIQLCGAVNGTVRASELLTLAPSARVRGQVFAERLIVEEGAKIDARVASLEAAMENKNVQEIKPLREVS